MTARNKLLVVAVRGVLYAPAERQHRAAFQALLLSNTRSGSNSICVPRPVQVGRAPCGWVEAETQ